MATEAYVNVTLGNRFPECVRTEKNRTVLLFVVYVYVRDWETETLGTQTPERESEIDIVLNITTSNMYQVSCIMYELEIGYWDIELRDWPYENVHVVCRQKTIYVFICVCVCTRVIEGLAFLNWRTHWMWSIIEHCNKQYVSSVKQQLNIATSNMHPTHKIDHCARHSNLYHRYNGRYSMRNKRRGQRTRAKELCTNRILILRWTDHPSSDRRDCVRLQYTSRRYRPLIYI